MNWRSKFKLLSGIIVTLVISGGLVLMLDYRQAKVYSETAEITADSYTVGIDFSGLITEQFVSEGDYVQTDEVLFHVKSTTLKQRMSELNLSKDELLYPLNDEGDVLISATRPGLVSKINHKEGSFVPANEIIAVLIDQTSLEVAASYRLARRDFQKLDRNTKLSVRLPGGEWTNGNVKNINVIEQIESYTLVELTTEISDSGEGQINTSSGVPVETSLQLNQTTLYGRMRSVFANIF